MTDKESLHFKIGLSGSSSKKQPKFLISLNGNKFIDTNISTEVSVIEYFEFDADVDEGDCLLTIELLNKTTYDTVLDNSGTIVEDLLLNIESIEVDDIDLGFLIWKLSCYKPSYPEQYKQQVLAADKELPEVIKNCVNLGWNGKWELSFTSPFYIWLLENI